jgi:hypothetical protein
MALGLFGAVTQTNRYLNSLSPMATLLPTKTPMKEIIRASASVIVIGTVINAKVH